MVLIANMPYIGPHFQISPDVSYNDHLLDVFVFSDMSKLDLISYAMQSTGGGIEDARIKHYRVKRLAIQSDPQMPVRRVWAITQSGPSGRGRSISVRRIGSPRLLLISTS